MNDNELIRRTELIARINGTGYAEQIKNNLLFIARMLPAVDAVEVVRCGECEHWERLKRMKLYGNCQNGLHTIDYFCADGQRREEEHNAAD